MATLIRTGYWSKCYTKWADGDEWLHVEVYDWDGACVWARTRYAGEFVQMRECVRRNWESYDIHPMIDAQLDQVEARWRNQAIDRVPPRGLRWTSAAAWAVTIFAGLAFWAAATIKLLELAGAVVVR